MIVCDRCRTKLEAVNDYRVADARLVVSRMKVPSRGENPLHQVAPDLCDSCADVVFAALAALIEGKP